MDARPFPPHSPLIVFIALDPARYQPRNIHRISETLHHVRVYYGHTRLVVCVGTLENTKEIAFDLAQSLPCSLRVWPELDLSHNCEGHARLLDAVTQQVDHESAPRTIIIAVVDQRFLIGSGSTHANSFLPWAIMAGHLSESSSFTSPREAFPHLGALFLDSVRRLGVYYPPRE